MSEEIPQTAIVTEKKAHGGLLPFLIDFGPLLVFFLVFKFSDSDDAFGPTTAAIKGTVAFMVAIVIAVAVSKWKLNRVSPMLWLSAILVLFFGGLTIYFHSEKFIQIKPTIIYVFFAVILGIGWLRGKPLLKYLLQAAYDGLDESGWMLLSRNWALFFAGMAVTNEVLRQAFDFDTWLTIKVWGITAASMVFAIANVPMLMRHGLAVENEPGA
ncbi:septation protein IspZ [Sphingorhabdus soli]|uniref:Inner membrane-spanning protein YciB n=1 Tax=Flavisphingopyxis soli TaxID=2601267 RepID=A0A5C6UAN8_9SPHN|nr:septation protein IspZ [Sphingorhabdus soli]TXC69026.1 septation protein IspZ [Sphingorhabdus soli]